MTSRAAKVISTASPNLSEEDIAAAVEVLRSGRLREGPVCRQFEEEFATAVGAKHAVAVHSGTAALHLLYLALLRPGDEVLVPSFSFVATASMVVAAGAKPVVCDVDARGFTLDPQDAQRRVTARTRLMVPVHLFGNACDIAGLETLARRHGLGIVWDAAQAHGTRYRGRDIGSFADAVCYSFYPSKNMTTGEGGMVVTNDPKLAAQCQLLRNHGQTADYRHERLGFNFRMTDFQAALGRSQLRRLAELVQRRRENAVFLSNALRDVTGLVLPHIPEGAEHSFNQYSVLLPGDDMPVQRDEFRQRLREKGIETGVYYPIPLHLQPIFAQQGTGNLPVSEDLARRIVSVPVHPGLDRQDLARIAEAVREAVRVMWG